MNMHYAISSIGWGRGETVQEALDNYLHAQSRNFRHLSREQILDTGGQVLRAPEGAEGFVTGYEDLWTDADQNPLSPIDYPEQVVAWIGVLPRWAVDVQGGDEIRARMAKLPVLRA